MDSDFWSGVRLVVNGLADAAKKASYCLGFGAGGFGVALVIVAKLGIIGPAAILISMSAFFILARLGKAVDNRLERAALENNLKKPIAIDGEVKDLIGHPGDLYYRLGRLELLQQESRQRFETESRQLSREILGHLEEQRRQLEKSMNELKRSE